MEEAFLRVVSALTLIIEAIAMVAIIISVFAGLWLYAAAFLGRRSLPSVTEVRARVGRGLVLSLEIFIAADLLRTIFQPTLQEVGVLFGIALLRIILSLSLEYELRQLQSGQEAKPTNVGEQPH